MHVFKNKMFRTIIALALFGSMFLFAPTIRAQGDTFGLNPIGKNVNLGGGDIRVTAAKIISAALGLLGIITVGIILYAGFLYMTAGGNEDQVGTAKKYIINAVIGLAIILSAFTITQFVLSSLDKAINGQSGSDDDGGGGDDDWPAGVCDKNSPDYNEAQCTSKCKLHPELSMCKKLAFYVESITPSTLQNDATGMNNITMRVLFSHPIDQATDLTKALTLKKDGEDTVLPITASLIEGNRVIEAFYKDNGQKIPPVVDKRYTLTVSSDVKDAQGKNLDTNYSFGGLQYPTTAHFMVDKNFADQVAPLIQNLTINNSGGQVIVTKGQTFVVGAKVNDRILLLKYGGVGLVRMVITEKGSTTAILNDLVAPAIAPGSSPEFLVSYTGLIDNAFKAGSTYTLTLSAFDINHKSTTATLTFKVQGSHCTDGILNGDETTVDTGGSCGTDNGLPIIKDVDPMNGASGNWISILGKNFGNQVGKVDFATDHNKNNKYDTNEWVPAQIVSCNGTPSWDSGSVVVQVPEAGDFMNNAAAQFNGINGHVEISGTTLELTNALTFEAWVKPDISGAYKTVLAKVDPVAKQGYFLAVTNLQPVIWLSGLKNPGWYSSPTKLPVNVWTHIVTTYDGSNIKFYINGNLDKIFPASGSVVSTPGKKLWLGMREDFKTINQFKGGLDEIALYSKVLTPEQILAHYNEAKKVGGTYDVIVNQDGPLGYWRLGESDGTAASDSSAYGIHGVYVGGVTLDQIGIFGPNTKKVGIGKTSAIRLTSVNKVIDGKIVEVSDSTVDDVGPKPGGDGLFIKNDIKRPGLCNVGVTKETTITLGGKEITLPINNPAALPGVPVTAHGLSLGTSATANKILFGATKDPLTGQLAGGYQGEVKKATDWTDLYVNTVVPDNLKIGSVAVHVTVAGETSNGVKFSILSPDAAKAVPIISEVDPVSTTPESYITIKGNGFGGTIDHVYVADSADHVATCGSTVPDASCRDLGVDTLPAVCGTTWTDTQIIAEIPKSLAAKEYYIAVRNGQSKLMSDGKDTFIVITGTPRPSICKIDPAKGPAPLATDSPGISIYGINFSTNPVLYYWQPKAEANTYSTWLNSLTDTVNGEPTGANVLKTKTLTKIVTMLPVGATGSSMSSGPIKVKSSAGDVSNGVHYAVEKCSEAKSPLPGYHCCTKGPDTDVWKKNSQMCTGESREAGYVWRFTTGIIGYVPSVVEECNATSFPSPTPRKIQGINNSACVNSSLALRFTTGMDNTSLTNNTVKVYACADKAGAIDCANKTPVTPLDLLYQTGANTLIIRQIPPQTTLTPNTWYQVELSEKIRSLQYSVIFGVGQYTSTTLAVTKPCGPGTAYCFTFKTGTEQCTLTGAGINPPNYTTHQLGVIQNPSYVFDNTQLYLPPNLPPNPFYYFVWGKGNQECSVINVDGFPWVWSPQTNGPDSDKALAFKPPATNEYVNSRAVVSAESHTAPGNVIIKAEADVSNTTPLTGITGTDILAAAGFSGGVQGFAPTDKVVLSETISSLLALQSSFTLQLKFSQSALFPYNTLLEKKNSNGPGIGYKIKYTSGGSGNKLCFITYVEPAANVGVNHCLDNPAVDANGVHNVLLTWNKEQEKLSWINLVAPLTSQTVKVTSIPVSNDPATLVSEKQPATDPGPVFFVMKYKNEPTEFEKVTGVFHYAPTSSLIIDLYDPAVIEYEPNCIESCVNAMIRAKFNRQMDIDTYAAGFKVYECKDGVECTNAQEINLYQVDEDSDYQVLIASLGIGQTLKPNTYYKVSLNGTNSVIKALNSIQPKKQGKALPKTEWIFKTRADGTPCSVGSIVVMPHPFVANAVGQKDKFIATPYSSPNACSKLGQALNKWDYQYQWSTEDTNVATVSGVGAAHDGNISPFCTSACVKKGSTIPKNNQNPNPLIPLCGNTTVDGGEDCDIGAPGESVGTSCDLNCLRPGNIASTTPQNFNNQNLCGNGIVETNVGEQCDPGHLENGNVKKDHAYCTAQCLLIGSSNQSSGKVGVACGDGAVTASQEVCDIKDPLSKTGCSDTCLHKGTPTAAWWCNNNKGSVHWTSQSCKKSVSVCGNGFLEPAEECEVGVAGVTPELCGTSCMFVKACAVGSTAVPNACTPSGSSPKYASVSLCGDQVVGAGEDPDCEWKALDNGNDLASGPAQMVEAKGQASVVAGTKYQETKIKASIATTVKVVEGKANYQLMCGYHEFVLPDSTGHYNDCVGNENEDGEYDNHLGVDGQSCCLPRPKWSEVYPSDGAGINGSPAICLNSLIRVRFDKEMRSETITNNILLVRGHAEANYTCATSTFDVTGFVTTTLQYSQTNAQAGFWATVWEKIKAWFNHLTGGTATATSVKNSLDITNITKWCANEIPVAVTTKTQIIDNATSTVASLAIGSLLDSNAVYGVIMRGNMGGIVDVRGVPLGAHDGLGRNDIWFFKTGNKDFICKIASVSVDPKSYLYKVPNSSADFLANAATEQGQLLSPIPGIYNWQWSWEPKANPVFSIPTPNTPTDKESASISAKNIEGHIAGIVSAKVTDDITEVNKQVGKSFTATFDLNALFCAHPWPNNDYPFKDEKYNFSSSYCSDAGLAGNLNDDLPYLNDPLIFSPSESQVIKKCSLSGILCESNQNCDATKMSIPPVGGVTVPQGQKLCLMAGTAPVLNGQSLMSCSEVSQCYFSSANLPAELMSDVVVVNKKAYLATKSGLSIYDVSDITKPVLVSSLATPGLFHTRVVVVEPYAYVSAHDGGLQIIDISNSAEPQLLNTTKAGVTTYDVAVQDKRAYVAINDKKIGVIDIVDPKNPKVVTTVTAPQEVVKVFVAQNRLVAAPFSFNGYVFDITNTDAPTSLGKFQVPGLISDVVMTSDMYHVSAIAGSGFSGGVYTVDPNLKATVLIVSGSLPTKSLLFDGGKLYTAEVSGAVREITFGANKSSSFTKTYTLPGIATISKIVSSNGNWYLLGQSVANEQIIGVLNKAVYDSNSVSCDNNFPQSWQNLCTTVGTNQVVVPAALAEDILRRYVFLNDKNDDAIGIQIFMATGTTIGEWYEAKFNGLGTMKPTVLSGYNALTDGNNYYIKALNYLPGDGTPGTDNVFHNVYLFSINPNAQPETRDVFNRLIKNLDFNINLTDHSYCLSGTGNIRTAPDDISTVTLSACSTDFDCRDASGTPKDGTNGTCSNAETKFHRDWTRLHAIQKAQDSLDAYFAQHAYDVDFKGALAGGSFVPGYTVSRWGQSWGLLQGLSGGGVAADPLNQWTDCGTGDKQTCWDASKTTYFCPIFASIYEYEYVSSTKNYVFHAPLEFFTKNDAVTKQFVTVNNFSTERWPGCATGSYNPFNQQCGDGILGPGEECDPPGTVVTSGEQCQIGKIKTKTCTKSCTWEIGACQFAGTCGNGIVEASEVCDDGVLNGTYGHCNKDNTALGIVGCTGLHGAYCGNNKIDFDDKNNNGQQNAGEKSYEFCEVGVKGATINYNLNKNLSCAWDCQGTGAYCGDGIVQSDYAEACDTGSKNGQGQCSATCTINKVCDYPTIPNKSCTSNTQCPITLLNGGMQVPVSDTAKVCMYSQNGTLAPIFSKKVGNETNFFYCQDHDEDCQDVDVYGGVGATIYADLTLEEGLTFQSDDFFLGDQPNFVCRSLQAADTYDEGNTAACKPVPSSICGNGSVEAPEQCDDSNSVSGDGCSATCATEPKIVGCGNNTVEPDLGEKCDLGTKNGVACVPGYGAGKSCTYCAGDCKTIQTVDSGAYCGNGVIESGEKCDLNAQGQTIAPKLWATCQSEKVACETVCQNGAGDPGPCKMNCAILMYPCLKQIDIPICPDKGSYQCLNNCTVLSPQCVACGLKDNGAIPKIAILNPILWSSTEWPDNSLFDKLYFYKPDIDPTTEASFQNAIGIYDYASEYAKQNLDMHEPQPFHPLATSFGSIKIESNPQCSGSYHFAFNTPKTNIDGSGQIGIYSDTQIAGTLFSYPVNGQVSSVNQDIIMSPSVPQNYFRVVIKWNGTDKDALLNGYIYNEKYSDSGANTDEKSADAVNYLERSSKLGLCSAMAQQSIQNALYWMPVKRKTPYGSVGGGAYYGESCFSTDGVQIHPTLHTNATYIQSYTVNTKYLPTNDKPFAFFISGIDKPITGYKSSSIEVQVYGYHPGQKPQYSIYAPLQTFKLSDAFNDNKNVNPAAQYWHVFNLVKQGNTYILKTVNNTDPAGQKVGTYQNGSIETDFSRILSNLTSAAL